MFSVMSWSPWVIKIFWPNTLGCHRPAARRERISARSGPACAPVVHRAGPRGDHLFE